MFFKLYLLNICILKQIGLHLHIKKSKKKPTTYFLLIINFKNYK